MSQLKAGKGQVESVCLVNALSSLVGWKRDQFYGIFFFFFFLSTARISDHFIRVYELSSNWGTQIFALKNLTFSKCQNIL